MPLSGEDILGPAPGAAKAGSLSARDILGPPPAPQSAPTLWSEATKPLRSIPGNIASEFRSGQEMVRSGLPKSAEDFGNPWLTALGGVQEAFSPITGIVKSLWTDPIEAEIPGPVGKALGKSGEVVLSGVGPAAVSKSLKIVADALPGLSKDVQKLLDAGVQMTPGQLLGGVARHAENLSTSVPLTGMAIANAQHRAMESFDRAIINKSLVPVGKSLPKGVNAGREAIAFADDAIGSEYDALLPKLRFSVDRQLVQDVQSIATRNTRMLDSSDQKKFAAILSDISGRMGPSASLSGREFKHVEEELNYISRTNRSSPHPSDREFAHAVDDLHAAMRDTLERTNPKYAAELQNINTAWAIFKRAQGASTNRVRSGGVFTPGDLLADIKRSTARGAFARGDGLLQELADAANRVLPSNIPDSGTAQRRLWQELFGLGSVGAAGEYTGVGLGPALGMAAGGAAYTRPGMAALRGAVGTVPRAVEALPALGPAAAAADAAAQERTP